MVHFSDSVDAHKLKKCNASFFSLAYKQDKTYM